MHLADKLLAAAKLIAERFGIKREDMSGIKTGESVERWTVAKLAEWKKLPEKLLRDSGLRNVSQGVLMPYFTVSGELYCVRYRLNRSKEPRFQWASGSRTSLYGLDRLQAIKAAGWCILCGGESDTWTCWHHGLPALGFPGKTVWQNAWAIDLAGIAVYIWQKPGTENFSFRVASDLTDLRIIEAPEAVKDISEAHVRGLDVPALIEGLKSNAIPAEELLFSQVEAERAKLRRKAGKIFGAADPIELYRTAIREVGYGGNVNVPLLVLLAVTSRLLKMRPGSIPVHMQLLAVPSAGKSYAITIVLAFMPAEAFHRIDAGSPMALIYDEGDLRHKIVIFDEIDSLPHGHNSVAASAIRNLLQEHHLKYKVVVYDNKKHKHVTREISRPGPSVLLTSGIRRTEQQLDSRLFCVEVPEDSNQVREALAMQAKIEIEGVPEPAEELIAYQSYLQTLAPWDVLVPFADQLAAFIGTTATASRVNRDFQRILSLIKSAAILRHKHRKTDPNGRLIAAIADYRTVYELVKDTYAAAVTGASKTVRQLVTAVAELRELSTTDPVPVSALVKRLSISRASASRRVKIALDSGWLINKAPRINGKSYDLDIGEPLPEDDSGLPRPEWIIDRSTDSPASGWDRDGMASDELVAIPESSSL